MCVCKRERERERERERANFAPKCVCTWNNGEKELGCGSACVCASTCVHACLCKIEREEREREKKKEREKEREIVFRNCEEYQEKHWNYVILTKLSSETQVHFRLKILAHKNINTFKWNQGQGERFLRKVRLPSGGDSGSARLMKNHTFSENKLFQS